MKGILEQFPRFLRRFIREPHIVIWRIIQCFVVWRVPASSVKELKTAQAILTQAASDLENDGSSVTNVKLAELADSLYGWLKIPIYAQGEVGRLISSPRKRTLTIWERRQRPGYIYPSSYGILEEQLGWCKKQSFERIIAIAYTHHLWRVVMMYRKAGFMVFVPEGIPDAWWQPGAEQKRHRTPFTSVSFEIVARLYFLYMGWI